MWAIAATALLWLHTSASLCCSQSTSSQWFSRNDDIAGQAQTVVNDPVWGVKILYPVEGAIEVSPVEFQVQINVHPGGEKQFAADYDDARFCVEVNGVTIFCSKLNELGYQYDQPGNCTARAYLKIPSDSFGDKIQSLSPPVSFTLVNETEFDAHIARQAQKNNEKLRVGFQLSLLEWVQLQQRQPDNEILLKLQQDLRTEGFPVKEEEFLLVVGVRTAAVSHFPFRQAIRETWASPSALPEGVKVLFLGCRPHAIVPDEDTNSSYGEPKLRRTWEAIELEKQVYGDLLTDEMDCDDDYLQLADKTKEFLHLAATRYSHAQYVMVADDDIYLRLDKIALWLRSLGPRERFYAGQVREIENARKTPPTRTTGSPHYLSEQVYPLNELPPFATGANFFLSMDCAQFVSKNRHRLRDLGGMDDISVALWMLTRQVHPMHCSGLQYTRAGPCRGNIVALSDLSAPAIRWIHNNILSQHGICFGFDRSVWMWGNNGCDGAGCGQVAERSHRLLSFSRDKIHFDIAPVRPKQLRVDKLIVTISTLTHAGLKVPFYPSNETVAEYSRRLCAQARLYFPGAVNACTGFRDQLRSALRLFYEELL